MVVSVPDVECKQIAATQFVLEPIVDAVKGFILSFRSKITNRTKSREVGRRKTKNSSS